MNNRILLVLLAASPVAGRLHDNPTHHHHLTTRTLLGDDYCTTLESNTTCYESGYPTCCNEDRECPVDQPPCEIDQQPAAVLFVEAEYCDNEPDESCYIDGWPICCQNVGTCPIDEQPPCDAIYTTSTMMTTTTFTTTSTVWTPPEVTFPTITVDPVDADVGAPYCYAPEDFTCYAEGLPACCKDEGSCSSQIARPLCDAAVTFTPSTYNPVELPVTAFPALTVPEGGLRSCNEVIPSDYPDDIIPKEVILALLQGLMNKLGLAGLAVQMESLVLYDVRARKVCTSCQEINTLWEANTNEEDEGLSTSKTSSASDAMPYCVEGSFAHGRPISGLLLEPIDSTTKQPIVGKVAATIANYATDPNPFLAPSQTWPSNVATSFPREFDSLAAASAGTYTIIPDVLGNGEGWQGVRSYMVKTLYQASAIPLLLKVEDDIEKGYSCTELDKRVASMGYSEGGFATVAVAQAIDMLDDGRVHTYTQVGGAPIKWSTAQLYAFVQLDEGTYPFPPFAARLGNSFSSTNGDLANTNLTDTDIQQNLASDEFLDSEDGTKDIREWAKAGLSSREMFAYMPTPPTGKYSDMFNPSFVKMVLSSYNAGNNDPCNSEFKTDDVDKLCEAIIDNDMSDFLQNIEYPVVICHSPEDKLIYFSNVPNTTANDNLIMIEDLPGMEGVLKPSGNHTVAAVQCLVGSMFPFMAPVETSNVRSIFPIEDSDGTCYGEETNTSSTSPSVGGATTTVSTTVVAADAVTTIPLIGTSWVATEFFDGNSLVEVIPGSTITLSFEDDTLSGNAGCNSYFMSVDNTTTSSFQIGPGGITEMYCEGEGLMSQESLYMQNFRGDTIGYNILDDGSLELMDAESNIIAHYVPQTSASGSNDDGATAPDLLLENSSPAFVLSTLHMAATGICVLMNIW